ncbi:exported hypothetical protein [Paraburkholderia piptadeniae]|uniref:Uncharacterized protein n=2 Tax=Paraburkholderia TaxID=1822464 RepID=A0A7X1TGT0_9BURK|nr:MULTISPECIES: hypothetical protein [Paraburkholderia]MPW18747.1 hypothetical protein [Paraburkholderia franconis]SIT48253.1 exported hypothetical protein [Paraburkholderia piptadeniae]
MKGSSGQNSHLMRVLALILSLTYAVQTRAQTSDVVTRTLPSSQTASTPTQRQTGKASWLRPETDHHAPNALAARRSNLRSRAVSQPSMLESSRNAFIGGDPDVARALVPCDALGRSMRNVSPSTTGAYASGSTSGIAAGVGYDPATGIQAVQAVVPSCQNMLSNDGDTTIGDRRSSAYEQITPDAVERGLDVRRPGTLTVLRPFAH